jgi:hypothetical protein
MSSRDKEDSVDQWVQAHHDRVLAAEATLRRAFADVGVTFEDSDDWPVRRIARWGHYVYEDLRFQDGESRRRVEVVRDRAEELIAALIEAWEYSGYDGIEFGDPDWPNDNGIKVNVCEQLFSGDLDETCIWPIEGIFSEAESALKQGRVKEGRGAPPNLAYAAFVLELHEVYVARTGKRGVNRASDGSAVGPFVDLVIAAQTILPSFLRLNERSTIENRILRALDLSR